MADEPILTQVYLTGNVLETGTVMAAWAEIASDTAIVHYNGVRIPYPGEGQAWHRTRSAAESYARQLQACELRRLRERTERIERYRFGRLGR